MYSRLPVFSHRQAGSNLSGPAAPCGRTKAEKTKTGFSPPPGLRPGGGMNRLTLESLILAQDERWRRA